MPDQPAPDFEEARRIAEFWSAYSPTPDDGDWPWEDMRVVARTVKELFSEREAREEAEQAFLDASIAVWREIDRLSDEPGGYKGLGPSNDLRVRERFAWEAYKTSLPATESATESAQAEPNESLEGMRGYLGDKSGYRGNP